MPSSSRRDVSGRRRQRVLHHRDYPGAGGARAVVAALLRQRDQAGVHRRGRTAGVPALQGEESWRSRCEFCYVIIIDYVFGVVLWA